MVKTSKATVGDLNSAPKKRRARPNQNRSKESLIHPDNSACLVFNAQITFPRVYLDPKPRVVVNRHVRKQVDRDEPSSLSNCVAEARSAEGWSSGLFPFEGPERFQLRLEREGRGRTKLLLQRWTPEENEVEVKIMISGTCNGSTPVYVDTRVVLSGRAWRELPPLRGDAADHSELYVHIQMPQSNPQLVFPWLAADCYHTDFSLVSSSGCECRVHRCVLEAAGGLLRYAARNERPYIIVNTAGLHILIQYLYLATPPNEHLAELLKVANLLQLKRLKDVVCKQLFVHINPWNAVDMMNLAIDNDALMLFYAIAEYIQENLSEAAGEMRAQRMWDDHRNMNNTNYNRNINNPNYNKNNIKYIINKKNNTKTKLKNNKKINKNNTKNNNSKKINSNTENENKKINNNNTKNNNNKKINSQTENENKKINNNNTKNNNNKKINNNTSKSNKKTNNNNTNSKNDVTNNDNTNFNNVNNNDNTNFNSVNNNDNKNFNSVNNNDNTNFNSVSNNDNKNFNSVNNNDNTNFNSVNNNDNKNFNSVNNNDNTNFNSVNNNDNKNFNSVNNNDNTNFNSVKNNEKTNEKYSDYLSYFLSVIQPK